MLRALLTAIRTLTILPVPGRDTEDFAATLPFFPWTGALIAAVLYSLYHVLTLVSFEQPFLAALLIAGGGTLLTGALHLDGLADVADGFGGAGTREKILMIFKDSRLGTFGVTALLFAILIKISLYGIYFSRQHFAFIAASLVFSRAAQAVALSFVPYGGISGGVASVFTGGKKRCGTLLSVVLAIIAALVVMGIVPAISASLSAGIVAILFVFLCIRKIGGITGDCIGALNELVEIAVLASGVISINLSQ